MNASNAKGKNILTAEMFREFRVIDHYLRDSDLSPSHGPRGPSDAIWTGTLRPFPGVDFDPITLIPEVMTPLPVLSKGIRDKIGKMMGVDPPYALGPKGTDACPDGYEKIVSEEDAKAAV